MHNDHPLSQDLTELSQEDLDKRYNDLLTRWHTARRINMNPAIMNQLDLLLQGFEFERQRRLQQPETTGAVLDTDGDYKKQQQQ